MLLILCGTPFSGKSTLAKELVKRLGFERIDLDEVKFELFGKDIKDVQIQKEGWDRVYLEMYRQIEARLQDGKTVISDTGNFTKHERGLVRAIGEKYGVEVITIFVDTPVSIAWNRLLENRKTKHRFDVADEDFTSSVAEMQPPTKPESHLVYGYADSIEQWIAENMQLLK